MLTVVIASLLLVGVVGGLVLVCRKGNIRVFGFLLLTVLILPAVFWPDKAVMLAWTPIVALGGFPSSQDHEHAAQLAAEIISKQAPPRLSASVPNRYPVSARPGTKGLFTMPMIVTIYYVTDPAHQDRIVEIARRFRAANQSKPIRIEFYEAENWIKEGSYGGHRGKEKLIASRKV